MNGAGGGARTGVLLCGHGSRSEAAVREFGAMAARIPALLPADWAVEHGYLEFANPVLHAALDRLRGRGCERILAVPGMLFAAMHSKNDIPTVLQTYAARHGLDIRYGRELGIDPKLVHAAADRVRAALADAERDVPLHDTCLVVIGRGASDPDANANVMKAARLLHEGLGTGWLEVGYSGVTFPLVEPCLRHVARLDYPRVVVLPWFLFSGILIDRIRGFTARVATDHPQMQFLSAGYLGDHPKVLEAFAERATEQVGEVPPPNCMGCKYRAQVLGFEAEVGRAQESHHHHVEGQGAQAPGSNVAACTLCDDFCTGLCRLEGQGGHHHAHHHHDHGHPHHDGRTHDHHHPAYPQANHPHGPESVRRKR